MIQTPNLNLIACDLPILEALVKSTDALQSFLEISIPAGWPEFPEAIPLAYKQLQADPDLAESGWGMYLFVHAFERSLAGSGGFKGRPDEAGMVEIGYEIAPSCRGQGLATEAARGLAGFAFSHSEVQAIDAHTLPERNASARVLEKLGMKRIGSTVDPEIGETWHWRIERNGWTDAQSR